MTIETEKNSKNDLNDFKSDALFLQNLFNARVKVKTLLMNNLVKLRWQRIYGYISRSHN